MTAFISANLAPIMFAAMVGFMLIGFPVAFALAACGLLFGLIGIELGMLSPALFQALPDRLFGLMMNETLLAIPFFTFMGLVLERSGMAEDLLDTIGQLFGSIRGGLAYAVIIVGAMLAATTGVVAASVISMGLISLPIMLRYGYDNRLASGVIAASGTLAQIIPPSLVLIVLADALGRSVGDMYRGAFLPGIILTALYSGFVFLCTVLKPASAPAVPPEARTLVGPRGATGLPSLIALGVIFCMVAGVAASMRPEDAPTDESVVVVVAWGGLVVFVLTALNRMFGLKVVSTVAEKTVFALVPPLALIFLVLGSIFVGLATPTEGGAMGATGAILLALIKRRLSVSLLRQAMGTTARLTAFVLFIVIGARIFSLTFYGIDGHLWVEHLFDKLPGGQLGFLILVNILVFLLAFFLDFFELAFIVVPLLAPVADKLGIDLIWFGILLSINMQTSFMHPPFGAALFFLRSVAPKEDYVDRVTSRRIGKITWGQIYVGSIPFVVIQLLMVGLVIAFPEIVSSGLSKQKVADPTQVERSLRELDSPSGSTLQVDPLKGLSND
ncbi:MAG TPA: TRAP transporter large permease subunit [Quisquiliibacterium sp.]|nr:TRAP transporter large permease subunit [Quisquiliibacterium sp.]